MPSGDSETAQGYWVVVNTGVGSLRFTDEFCKAFVEAHPRLEEKVAHSRNTLTFLPRHHPGLVRLIQEWGCDRSAAGMCVLRLVEIPLWYDYVLDGGAGSPETARERFPWRQMFEDVVSAVDLRAAPPLKTPLHPFTQRYVDGSPETFSLETGVVRWKDVLADFTNPQ